MSKDKARPQEILSYNEYVEVTEAELNSELNRVHLAISPLTMVSRRLRSGKMSAEDAATAIDGMSVLIHEKCREIIELLGKKEDN